MAVPSGTVWLLVAFAALLIGHVPAMESRGDAISLDSANSQAPSLPTGIVAGRCWPADAGARQMRATRSCKATCKWPTRNDCITKLRPTVKRSAMGVPSLAAPCPEPALADIKCASFSWNQELKDCFISRSAISYNPAFNYYSRISKKAREEGGSALPDVGCLMGMIFPRRGKFQERWGVSLNSCMEMCDAGPPVQRPSKERLYEHNPDQKNYNRGDGCSAFSYSRSQQLCLLKGDPVAYAPGYNYFVKRSVENTAVSHQSAAEKESDGEAKGQKAAAKTDDEKAEKEEAAKKEGQKEAENQQIEKEQAKVKQEAEEEAVADAQVKQKAKQQNAPPVKKMPSQEQTLKETTKKDLEKERRMQAKRVQQKEKGMKEKGAKEQMKANEELAAQMTRKAEQMRAQKNERKMKGNLDMLLNEMVDKSQLVAQSERDLKSAITAGKEHNTKEKLVKLKIRKARMERFEQEKQTLQKNEQAAESGAAATVTGDENRLGEEKAAAAKKEFKLEGDQDKEKTLKQKLFDAQGEVDKLKKLVEQKEGDQSAEAEVSSIQTDQLPEAEEKVADLKSKVEVQQAKVKERQNELNKALQETAAGKLSLKQAEDQISQLQNSVKYVLKGLRPMQPSAEDATLYRIYAKEVGLPVPGDGTTPVGDVTPPDPNANPQQLMEAAVSTEATAIKQVEGKAKGKVAGDEAAVAAVSAEITASENAAPRAVTELSDL